MSSVQKVTVPMCTVKVWEGLETEEADEGYRILEETKDKLDSQRPILQRSFDI